MRFGEGSLWSIGHAAQPHLAATPPQRRQLFPILTQGETPVVPISATGTSNLPEVTGEGLATCYESHFQDEGS